MYICQDKCYRLVPQHDHRYAQFDDYIEGAVFCGICSVVIGVGAPEAQQKMTSHHKETGSWICPCCSAKPRGYFDIKKARLEFYLRTLHKTQRFFVMTFNSPTQLEERVDEFFRLRKLKKLQSKLDKEWKARLKPQAAPPSRPKKSKAMIATKLYKLTMYPIQTPREISMFPTQQQ